jgi:hypothetical protein
VAWPPAVSQSNGPGYGASSIMASWARPFDWLTAGSPCQVLTPTPHPGRAGELYTLVKCVVDTRVFLWYSTLVSICIIKC